MTLGSVADWVSAIGTVSACIIALWLAGRQSRPQCTVHTHLWGYSNDEESPTLMRAVDVSVRNVGYQPFSVSLCMLEIGLLRPVMIDLRGDGPGGPILLEHAESVNYTFDLLTAHQSVQSAFAARRFGWIERRFRRSLKAAVYLSSGEMRRAIVDGASRRVLLPATLPPDAGWLPNPHRSPKYFKARTVESTS